MVGGVTNSHRSFATGAEGNTGGESDLGFEQQPLAKIE
jgi:hypothetical protein